MTTAVDDQPDPTVEPEDDAEGSEPEGQKLDTAALVAAIVDQVSARTTSEIDRRIGGLMKTLQTEYGLKKGDAAPVDVKPETVPDRLGRRLLKSAIRETMADKEFTTADEKGAAWRLASMLADTAPLGGDDYETAEKIVDEVMTTLQGLRTTYETQVRADLKRRGLLTDEPKDEEGQPPKRPGQGRKTPQQAYDAGATRAAAMFPGRVRKKGDEGE